MIPTARALEPRIVAWSNRRLAAGWVALLLGALLLVACYPDLPDSIPAYRTLLGTPYEALPKSPFSVFRIVAMGVGQLGATTLMTREAARAVQRNWVTFWVAASMAAGAKTLIECVQLALLQSVEQPTPAVTFVVAALLPVAAFLAVGVKLWLTRSLEPGQAIPLPRMVGVGAFVALWLLFAILPWWLSA